MAATLILGAAPAEGASAAVSVAPALVTVGGAVALPPGATPLGVLSPATPLRLDVFLRPRDPARLARLATAVSTPGSPLFRHYLRPGQFARRFGATPATVAGVERSLHAAGLTRLRATADLLAIGVETTAGAAEAAFHATLRRYRLAGGRTAYANVSAPRVSGLAAGAVGGVLGLDSLASPVSNFAVAHRVPMPAARLLASLPSLRPRPSRSLVAVAQDGPSQQSCEDTAQVTLESEDPSGQGAWTYNQLATLYGFGSLYAAGDEGAGVTIALAETDSDLQSDVQSAWECLTGTTTPAPDSYVAVDGGQGLGSPSSPTPEGEAALDIDVAMALAPQAHVLVYQGAGAGNFAVDGYDVYQAIVDQDAAQVVSSSFGTCETITNALAEGILPAENALFEQAALQGQSVLAAAGDSGSESCSRMVSSETQLSVLDVASQPFVTGVGGTSLECGDFVLTWPDGAPTPGTNLESLTTTTPEDYCYGPSAPGGSDYSVPFETAWNDGPKAGAGGGGISNAWAMPPYQAAAAQADPGLDVLQAGISSGTPCGVPAGSDCREVPDVSASADPHWGYMTYNSGQLAQVGGTSAATPLWAALVALADASSACGGRPLGFLNPALYAAASSGGYSSDFHDIVPETNVLDQSISDNEQLGLNGGLYPVTSGYDMATGLGSPTAALPGALCAAARTTAEPASTLASSFGTPADGSGSVAVSPGSATAGSSGNTFDFTFTAGSSGMSVGTIDLTVPAGWPAPSTSVSAPGDTTVALAAGDTTDSPGGLVVANQDIVVSGVSLGPGAILTITYGARGGGGPGVTVPSSAGTATFAVHDSSSYFGSLAPLASSPGVSLSAPAPTGSSGPGSSGSSSSGSSSSGSSGSSSGASAGSSGSPGSAGAGSSVPTPRAVAAIIAPPALRRGILEARLSCAGSACAGTAEVEQVHVVRVRHRAREKVRVGRRTVVRVVTKVVARREVVVLAETSWAAPPGASPTVTLRLTPAGRRLLASVRVRERVVVDGRPVFRSVLRPRRVVATFVVSVGGGHSALRRVVLVGRS